MGDATTLDDGSRGELDVLGEHVVLPTAHLVDDLGADEESGAGHCAAGAQRKASLGKILRLAHEPHGVACGDPIGTVVLGVAVAGRGNGAAVERFVHLAEVVHVKHVVGIEHEVRLVLVFAVVLADAGKAIIERVALADLLGVETREHDRASLLGNGSGVVGAVIGDNEDVDELLRIVLHANAVDKIADNGVLVARGNDYRIAMVLLRRTLRRLLRERYEHIEDLVHIADGEHDKDAEVKDVHKREGREKLV